MSYKNINELKQLPKDEAKYLYKAAYSRFKASEKSTYFKLSLLVGLCAGLGAGIGLYFSNETHLGALLAGIGAFIGQYFMTRRIEQKMKPYLLEVINESST